MAELTGQLARDYAGSRVGLPDLTMWRPKACPRGCPVGRVGAKDAPAAVVYDGLPVDVSWE
jgi:hypothetical protein